jgi:hypothetical protein
MSLRDTWEAQWSGHSHRIRILIEFLFLIVSGVTLVAALYYIDKALR